MEKKEIIEWAPFSIKEGVTDQMLLEASQVLQQDFLNQQEGFIKRELLRKSAKEFVDVVYWRNKETAEKAVAKAANSPACFAYFQLMMQADHNNPAQGIEHLELMDTYANAYGSTSI